MPKQGLRFKTAAEALAFVRSPAAEAGRRRNNRISRYRHWLIPMLQRRREHTAGWPRRLWWPAHQRPLARGGRRRKRGGCRYAV